MPKEIRLKLEQERVRFKNKTITVMLKSGDWTDSLDNFIEQETWKRN